MKRDFARIPMRASATLEDKHTIHWWIADTDSEEYCLCSGRAWHGIRRVAFDAGYAFCSECTAIYVDDLLGARPRLTPTNEPIHWDL